MMNKVYELIRLGSLALLIASLGTSCGSSESKAERNKEPVEPVRPAVEVIALKKDKISTSFRSPGELIAFQQVDLYAKEVSFVKKLFVDVGSQVKSGQLLATMDAPEISTRLAAAESRVKA